MTFVATFGRFALTGPPRTNVAPITRLIVELDRRCVPSLAPPVELFRALSGAFRRLNAPWYVFGAQAVLLWGRPRLTADIDVTVQIGPADSTRLVASMQESGFVMRVHATQAFIEQTRVMPFMHTSTEWPVDIVLAGPGLEEEFLRRAVTVEVEPGLSVLVISAEDLIVTKILSGRSKDIDDVRGVLAERVSQLDTEAIRFTLAQLEDALGVSDLMPVWDAELARARPK